MTLDARYARHALIPGWDQQRLAQAQVIIIGLGALGNEVARILALSGVGSLLLCDPDRVERSNLSRCALFRKADEGQFKVNVAARALVELAPALQLQTRPLPLIHGLGLAELRDASLILACLDSQAARVQLAGRCNLVQAASIDGGTHPWGGEIRSYLQPSGPCYACGLSAQQRSENDSPWSCLDANSPPPQGANAVSSVLVGAWQALAALRYLMGQPGPVQRVHIDGCAGRARPVEAERDPDCPLHHPIASPQRLSLSHHDTVAQLCAALQKDTTPLAWEAICQGFRCSQCGHQESHWGRPQHKPCPHCAAPMRAQTTLALDQAPGQMRLVDLGIAPREILALRTEAGMAWGELAAGKEG